MNEWMNEWSNEWINEWMPPRQRIQSLTPGGLRSSTQPFDHGDSPQHYPAGTRRWDNVGLMLANRLRRLPNIQPTNIVSTSRACWVSVYQSTEKKQFDTRVETHEVRPYRRQV